jgi:hypothetical protein
MTNISSPCCHTNGIVQEEGLVWVAGNEEHEEDIEEAKNKSFLSSSSCSSLLCLHFLVHLLPFWISSYFFFFFLYSSLFPHLTVHLIIFSCLYSFSSCPLSSAFSNYFWAAQKLLISFSPSFSLPDTYSMEFTFLSLLIDVWQNGHEAPPVFYRTWWSLCCDSSTCTSLPERKQQSSILS